MNTFRRTHLIQNLTNYSSFSTKGVTGFLYLPASEFGGQLGEEVGGGPGAGVGQRAGFMVWQGGWSRRGGVDRGPAVPQLSSVKGAADCGSSGQAASVWRRGGGSGSSSRDTERGGRRCRHAVTERAEGGDNALIQQCQLHYLWIILWFKFQYVFVYWN